VVAGVSDFQVSTFHSGSINLKAFLVFISLSQGNTGNCIDIDICDRGLGIVLNFRLFCVKFLCVLMACLVTYVTVTLVLMREPDDETDEAHEGLSFPKMFQCWGMMDCMLLLLLLLLLQQHEMTTVVMWIFRRLTQLLTSSFL
jgi:hypothetical protein